MGKWNRNWRAQARRHSATVRLGVRAPPAAWTARTCRARPPHPSARPARMGNRASPCVARVACPRRAPSAPPTGQAPHAPRSCRAPCPRLLCLRDEALNAHCSTRRLQKALPFLLVCTRGPSSAIGASTANSRLQTSPPLPELPSRSAQPPPPQTSHAIFCFAGTAPSPERSSSGRQAPASPRVLANAVLNSTPATSRHAVNPQSRSTPSLTLSGRDLAGIRPPAPLRRPKDHIVRSILFLRT
jgi:hypothetical protein